MPLLVAVGLLSAAAIGFEVLLARLLAIVLWQHFAAMIISLALLGYGASGTLLVLAGSRLLPRFATSFALLAAAFGVATTACSALAWRLPLNPLQAIWDWRQPLWLAAMYLTLALPFLAAASAIGLGLAAWTARIGAIYRADLAGAAGGAIVVLSLMLVLPPEDCLRIIAAVAFVAAALAALGEGRRQLALGLALLALPVALAWPAAWLRPAPSPYKGLSLALTVPGAHIVAERSGLFGRLTAVSSPTIPFRYAPGLSLATSLAPPEQIALFTDGEGMTAVTRFRGDLSALGHLDQQTAALPFHLLDRPATLVLGAGGGAEILRALYHRAPRIDAVELNRQLVDLVRGVLGDFAGGLYEQPTVAVHVAEARNFVESSSDRWDLIQLALLDSAATSAAGLQALSESPIYTIEALRTYLDHLNPAGIVAITRWLGAPPRDAVKLLATAIAALEASGVARPGERLALLHDWSTATLLMKNGGFTATDIAALRRFATERQFDLAWYPGITAGEPNRYNRLASPTLYDAATALLGPGRDAFLDSYPFDIRPTTDDRPFFFRFFKWSLLPALASSPGRAAFALVDAGYLVVLLALPQAVAAALVLILLPLAGLRMRDRPPEVPRRVEIALYFLLLGFAFLFVEIAFIHRFSLFLGHPVIAFAVTLASFLLAAGLGSGLSGRAAARWPRSAIRLAVAAIVGLGVLYALALQPLLAALLGWPPPAKIAVAVGLIAPLGLAMGLPFPLGLSLVARQSPALVPWAWGINGSASVVAAVLASLLAMHLGFAAVLALALGLYAAAALLFGRGRAASGPMSAEAKLQAPRDGLSTTIT